MWIEPERLVKKYASSFDDEYEFKNKVNFVGYGDNTYLFGRGDGQDIVMEKDNGASIDTLKFKNGISKDDLMIRKSYDDLIVGIRGTLDTITIKHQFYHQSWGIDKIVFADFPDEVIDVNDIDRYLILTTEGDDNITGHQLNLHGLGGDDHLTTLGGGILYGNAGNDTLIGEYNFVNYLYGGEGNDTLQGHGELYGEEGDDEIEGSGKLYGGDGQDKLNGKYNTINYYDGGLGNDKIMGSGQLYGNEGDDELIAIGEHNQLYGGLGNDTLNGSGLLHGDEGHDILTGKGELYGDDGDDKIYGIGKLLGGSGNDILMLSSAGEPYFNVEQLTSHYPNAYVVYPADSSLLDGGDGNDILDASLTTIPFGSANIGTKLPQKSEVVHYLRGGKGKDILYGSFHHDVYLFDLGDGHDTIIETRFNQGFTNVAASYDRIQFGQGIQAKDLQLFKFGTDLIIKHQNNQDSITIKEHFSRYNTNPHFKIDEIQFYDGTHWDLKTIERKAKSVARSPLITTRNSSWNDQSALMVEHLKREMVYGDEKGEGLVGFSSFEEVLPKNHLTLPLV